MSKHFKKLAVILAALVLALAIGLPVFAAGAGEGAEGQPESPPANTQEIDETDPSVTEEPEGGSPETAAECSAATATDIAAAAGEDAGAEVGSYADLKKALEGDNGITHVTLTADITATAAIGGITINTNKTDVVIDGGGHTFTQYNSGDSAGAIRVTSAAIASVTLRRLNVAGGNAFGVVWVADAVAGITLSHEDVTYTGPQAFYNRNGTVRAADSAYTLQTTGGQATGEWAEARHTRLAGKVSISTAQTGNSILWLVGSTATLTVEAGADVTVETPYYFLFTGGSQPTVSLEAGAAFSLTTRNYGFTYGDQRVGSFTLAENARLTIDHKTSQSYAALRVSKLFSMAPGSSATILRTGTDGIPLRLTDAGAQVNIDRPERLFLYSTAGVPMRFTGGGSLKITTSAINLWQTAAWPLAGGTDPLPSHIWNRAGGQLLTLTATYNTTIQSLVHDLQSDDPVTTTLNAGSFDLEHTQLLALGALTLDIDTPTSESPALAGATAPQAELLAAYILADGRGAQIGGAAGTSGRYSLPVTGGALKVGSTVTMLANSAGLTMRQNAIVEDGAAYRLAFLSVPQTLQFGSVPVPGGQTLVGRQNLSFPLVVGDSRLSPSPWRIDASLTGPLSAQTAAGISELLNAVVYREEGGEPLALNEVPTTVYRQSSGAAGEYSVQWGQDEGILLSLSPGSVYSGVDYTATIHWQLVDAP